MILSRTLPKAWTAFTKNKKYLIPIILIEFVLLFVMTQLHLYYFMPTAEAATRAGDIMTTEIQKLPETEMYQLETILVDNEEFMQAYRDLLKLLGMFILLTFIALTALKLPVWHLAHKSILKKMPWKTTLTKFPLLSLMWGASIGIIFIIYSIATGSTATILPLFSTTGTSLLVLALLFLVYYYSQVSYALIPSQHTFKETFTIGTKKALKIIPAFLVNLIITFIVLTLPFNWLQTMPMLTLIIITLITIPALAFTRLHMITAVWLAKTKPNKA